MTGWLAWLRDRPVVARERRTAITAVAVLLTASTILLAATHGATRSHDPQAAGPVASAVSPSRVSTPVGTEAPAASVAPAAGRAARVFLAGYLSYLYGHGSASSVAGATPALARSLRAKALLVPPAMRARYPRVVSLHATPAPAGLVVVSALVNDGELASYPVGLLLVSERGRLLVSAVEGA